MSPNMYSVLVFDEVSGVSSTLMIYDGITHDELSSLLNSTFRHTRTVALRDGRQVVFPLKLIAQYPVITKSITKATTVVLPPNVDESSPQLSRQNAVGNLRSNYHLVGSQSSSSSSSSSSSTPLSTAPVLTEASLGQAPLRHLSLEEAKEELSKMFGFGNVDVRSVIGLLQPASNHNGDLSNGAIPLTISRTEFVNCLILLASLARDSEDEELYSTEEESLNLLFDVLANSSEQKVDVATRSYKDEIDVATFASGLTVLCNGDEMANLETVFELFCRQDYAYVSINRKDRVSDVSAYLHLATVFRLVFQLSRQLRKSSPCSPEELAYRHSLRHFTDITQDTGLSFKEFGFICKSGFRQGLDTLYRNHYDHRMSSTSNEEESPRFSEEKHDLPTYTESHTHPTVDEIPPSFHESHYDKTLDISDEALDTFLDRQRPIKRTKSEDSTHSGKFVVGNPGNRVFHHRDAAVDDEDTEVPDSHFTEAVHGVHHFKHKEIDSDDSHVSDTHFMEGIPGVDFFEAERRRESAQDLLSKVHRGKQHEEFPEEDSESDESMDTSDSDSDEAIDAMAQTIGKYGKNNSRLSSFGSTVNNNEKEDDDDEDDDDDENADTNLEDSLIAASLVEYDGGPIDIAKAQQILGFKQYNPDIILSSLILNSTDDGFISLSSYHRFIDQMMRKHYGSLSVLQRSVADYIVSTIFDTFDTGTDLIKMEELGWALLVMCGGEPEIKARAATSLINSCVNIEAQKGIKADDMTRSLLAIMKLVSSLNHDLIDPKTPAEISTELTMHAFNHAGANCVMEMDNEEYRSYFDRNTKPSVISISEFEHWFGVVIQQFEFDLDSLPYDSRFDGDSFTLDTNDTSYISEDATLRSSMESGGFDLANDQYERNLAINNTRQRPTNIYTLEQRRKNLTIDTHLAPSDSEDDGHLIGSVYPEELLNYADVNAEYDLDGDYEAEDSELCRTDDNSNSNSDVPSRSLSDYHEDEDDDEDNDNDYDYDYEGEGKDRRQPGREPSTLLKELRLVSKLLGLDGFPADDLMEMLGERSREGVITISRFIKCLGYIIKLAGLPKEDMHASLIVGKRIFAHFVSEKDKSKIYGYDVTTGLSSESSGITSAALSVSETDDENDIGIDYNALTAGLCCLCSSSIEEKLMVCFALFDADSDGYITLEEMKQFVESVLKVVLAVSGTAMEKVKSSRANIDQLTAAVITEISQTFGIVDTKLNVETVIDMCSDYVLLAQSASF